MNEIQLTKIKNRITALELTMAIFEMKYSKVMDKDAKMDVFEMSELIRKISSNFNIDSNALVKMDLKIA